MLVYRVVQEAVRNAAHHSGAEECRITLTREGQTVTGTVADDGCGFDMQVAAGKGRLGILGMKDRCELVGGKLSVETAPGEGTRVLFSLVDG